MADEVNDNVETEIAEPLSQRDDVNADVAAALASLKAEPEPEPTEPVDDGRARGPDGKFIPKDAAPEVAAAPVKESPPPEDVTKASEQPSTAAVAPPVSWAADVKAQWQSLPPAVQQAVLKREAEVSAGFRQYSEKTARYEQALAPVAQAAQARGLSVDDGIKRLMDGQTFLETQPAQAILWLAQKNGIDLAELASNPPAPQRQAQPDPAFAHVSQTVSSLEQRLQQIEFGQNLTVAQQFAQSKPYYADVEDQLPDLIKEIKQLSPGITGIDLLERAYERAIWLNPEVRSKVIAAEQASKTATHTQAIAEKSARASKAAVSLKGSSAASAPAKRPVESNGTAYDDVRAAIQQLRAG